MTLTPLVLFCSAYLTVFTLGMQHHFVANRRYVYAAMNSTLIGTMSVIGYRMVPDASLIEVAAYILGGPAGIVSSMLFWKHFMHEKNLLRTKK